MYRLVEAIYKNGEFILTEKLNSKFEGKKLKLIVLVNDEMQESKKKKFLNFVNSHTYKLPDGYSFNREELYRR